MNLQHGRFLAKRYKNTKKYIVCSGLLKAQRTPAALTSRINKGINILVGQLTVWHWVVFSFPAVNSIVVNTAVNLVRVAILDTVVAMVTMVTVVAVVIRVMIQLCVLH